MGSPGPAALLQYARLMNGDCERCGHILPHRASGQLHECPSDDSCRCNEQARELGGEALRRVEAEQGRLDDERRGG